MLRFCKHRITAIKLRRQWATRKESCHVPYEFWVTWRFPNLRSHTSVFFKNVGVPIYITTFRNCVNIFESCPSRTLVTSWFWWLTHKLYVASRAFMNTNFLCLFSSVALFAVLIHFTGSVIYFNIHVLQRWRFVLHVLLESKNTFEFDYKWDDTFAIIFTVQNYQ
jgi:hypothetical protein